MTNFIALAIIVVAVVVAALAGRAAWLRRAASPGGRFGGRSAAATQGELVAVISAAVAAASGLEPGSFRIVGIRSGSAVATEGAGSPFARGLNTPAWGHVDRFIQGE